VKKQENHMLDIVLSAIGNDNVDVYLNRSGSVFADIVERLTELGIEVKQGQVYQMPENPVMPSEEDFAGNQSGYKQAQKDFHSKQAKWDALQSLLERGLARKALVLDSFVPYFGYIMVQQEVENSENLIADDNRDAPSATETGINPEELAEGNFEKPDDTQIQSTVKVNSVQPAIRPDLISTLEQKDRKNREEALCKVIADAKKLMKDTDIPPVEITPFEEALMYYIMLSDLDIRHYEFFGIIEGLPMTEEDKLILYNALSDEQKNVLKRDFLISNMTQGTGITKRAALLVELAKYHFPEDMAIIEGTHNEEYLKKREVILEQIEKLKSKNEELQEVA